MVLFIYYIIKLVFFNYPFFSTFFTEKDLYIKIIRKPFIHVNVTIKRIDFYCAE